MQFVAWASNVLDSVDQKAQSTVQQLTQQTNPVLGPAATNPPPPARTTTAAAAGGTPTTIPEGLQQQQQDQESKFKAPTYSYQKRIPAIRPLPNTATATQTTAPHTAIPTTRAASVAAIRSSNHSPPSIHTGTPQSSSTGTQSTGKKQHASAAAAVAGAGAGGGRGRGIRREIGSTLSTASEQPYSPQPPVVGRWTGTREGAVGSLSQTGDDGKAEVVQPPQEEEMEKFDVPVLETDEEVVATAEKEGRIEEAETSQLSTQGQREDRQEEEQQEEGQGEEEEGKKKDEAEQEERKEEGEREGEGEGASERQNQDRAVYHASSVDEGVRESENASGNGVVPEAVNDGSAAAEIASLRAVWQEERSKLAAARQLIRAQQQELQELKRRRKEEWEDRLSAAVAGTREEEREAFKIRLQDERKEWEAREAATAAIISELEAELSALRSTLDSHGHREGGRLAQLEEEIQLKQFNIQQLQVQPHSHARTHGYTPSAAICPSISLPPSPLISCQLFL